MLKSVLVKSVNIFVFLGLGVVLSFLSFSYFSQNVKAATIVVNETQDELNSDGDCSLREAIRTANLNTQVDGCVLSGGGTDTITLGAGTYNLTLAGRGEEAALTGDLDIIIPESLIINGVSKELTIIDGGGLDRIFDIKSNIDDGVNPPAGPITEVTLNNLTIQNGNPGSNSGGGIMNRGELTLNNVVVKNNIIEDFYWGGGGINSDGYSSLTLNNSTIDGNTGHVGGGIYLYEFSNFSSNNSTISNNTSPDDGDLVSPYGPGGGIVTFDTVTLNIVNTTISGNTAVDGGGFHLGPSAAGSIVNTTITDNTATSGFGAGIYGDWQESTPTLTIKNTIISGNNGQNCKSEDPLSQGYNLYDNNLISDPDSCVFNITGDINTSNLFIGPLQDNGGTTFTHALQITSPAIDSADNVGCPATDQRGITRPFDADGDLNAVCDIGAYEYMVVVTNTPTPSFTPTASPTLTSIPTNTPVPTNTSIPTVSATSTPIPTSVERTSQITGHLFVDTNNNGTQDPGEPNLANVTIIVTDSLGEVMGVTDSNGNYSINVAGGNVTLGVDPNDPDLPSGYSVSTGNALQTFNISAGAVFGVQTIGIFGTDLAQTGQTSSFIITQLLVGCGLLTILLVITLNRRYKIS